MSSRVGGVIVLSVLIFSAGLLSARTFEGAAGPSSLQQQPAPAPAAGAQRAGGGGVPGFLQVNRRYTVRWQPGDNEVYRVLEIRDGWLRARRDAGNAAQEGAKAIELWINPAQAITITEEK